MKKSFGEMLRSLFSGKKSGDGDFFDGLTDILVEGDIGAACAYRIVDELEDTCSRNRIRDEKEITSALRTILLKSLRSVELEPEADRRNIWMVLGVNGVGKTTTAAKLAAWYKKRGVGNIVLASADTFRAAAIEQLALHGERTGVRVVSHQHGSDPSAVVFDAAEAVAARGPGLVIADTAGRLHNKENLVRELQKIDRICRSKADDGCYRKIIVIDATTGQNAVRQVEVFNDSVGVDAVILTKYDSTARGGAAVTIGREFGIPVAFVCTGEKYGDMELFSPEKYVDDFLGNA